MPTTPRLLNAHDQRLSDRAADACRDASIEQRAEAWRVALRLGEDVGSRAHVYGAWCLLVVGSDREHPSDSDILHFADELAEIERNYDAAVAARKATG